MVRWARALPRYSLSMPSGVGGLDDLIEVGVQLDGPALQFFSRFAHHCPHRKNAGIRCTG